MFGIILYSTMIAYHKFDVNIIFSISYVCIYMAFKDNEIDKMLIYWGNLAHLI